MSASNRSRARSRRAEGFLAAALPLALAVGFFAGAQTTGSAPTTVCAFLGGAPSQGTESADHTPELPREWIWEREPIGFGSMYGG